MHASRGEEGVVSLGWEGQALAGLRWGRLISEVAGGEGVVVVGGERVVVVVVGVGMVEGLRNIYLDREAPFVLRSFPSPRADWVRMNFPSPSPSPSPSG